MTEAQRTRFYFPAWLPAAKALDWVMVDGRLLADLGTQWHEAAKFSTIACELVREIIGAAQRLAAAEQRAVTATDLRHAANQVASRGRTTSGAKLSNKELNEFARMCAVIRNPFENLNSAIPFIHPAEDDRQRSIAYLRRLSYEGQLRAISENMFKTREWESLPAASLDKLILVVKKSGRTRYQPF